MRATCGSTDGRALPLRRAMRSPPASAWCTRNFASRRISRVAENVFLGVQPVNRFGIVDWRRMAREAERAAPEPRPRHRSARAARRSRSACSSSSSFRRVLFSGARIIILDEPTSALSPPEIARLFEVLRRLRASGRSIIFISHFLDDILDDFRRRHGLPQRPEGRDRAGDAGDRQGLDHRAA